MIWIGMAHTTADIALVGSYSLAAALTVPHMILVDVLYRVAPALPLLLTRAYRTERRAHLTTHAKNVGLLVKFHVRRNDRTHVLFRNNPNGQKN